jgi:hypothetical protein
MIKPAALKGTEQTRRHFLVTTAGASIAAVALTKAASLPVIPASTARATSVAGATVDAWTYGLGWNRVAAAQRFNSYTKTSMAAAAQKIYFSEGEYWTHVPKRLAALSSCMYLISVRPRRSKPPGEQAKLRAFTKMMVESGVPFRLLLWQEPDDGDAFKTQQVWLDYWSYYAPVILAEGAACCYDPGCNPEHFQAAMDWFPVSPRPSELWMDFYACSYSNPYHDVRVDPLIALAAKHGIHSGFAETGLAAGTSPPPTRQAFGDYCHYVASLAPRVTLGAVWFGTSTTHPTSRLNVVEGPSDWKIPGIRTIAAAYRGS